MRRYCVFLSLIWCEPYIQQSSNQRSSFLIGCQYCLTGRIFQKQCTNNQVVTKCLWFWASNWRAASIQGSILNVFWGKSRQVFRHASSEGSSDKRQRLELRDFDWVQQVIVWSIKHTKTIAVWFYGSGGRDRTYDQLINSFSFWLNSLISF